MQCIEKNEKNGYSATYFRQSVNVLIKVFVFSSVNDRPFCIRNDNMRRPPQEHIEFGEFRRALPQFLAVSVKNILLFGEYF